MKVFISGASGLVGGNCMKYFREKGWQVTGSHFSFATNETVYFDSLHPDNPESFDIIPYAPNVIVHCGALTHVDYCEDHPEESYEKTVTSTMNLVALARKTNARFVFISTDYVFDGENGPYRETDTTHPLSVYGKHKLEAEQYVMKHCPDALVLRVTNVYGDEIRGKNFVSRILDQCRKGQKLTLKLPYDQTATPVNARDIARIMHLLLRDHKSGLYHIAGSDFLNRVELALRIMSYFPGVSYELEALRTEDLHQPAARPLTGGFVKMKLAAEYPDFLFGTVDSYIQEKLKE